MNTVSVKQVTVLWLEYEEEWRAQAIGQQSRRAAQGALFRLIHDTQGPVFALAWLEELQKKANEMFRQSDAT